MVCRLYYLLIFANVQNTIFQFRPLQRNNIDYISFFSFIIPFQFIHKNFRIVILHLSNKNCQPSSNSNKEKWFNTLLHFTFLYKIYAASKNKNDIEQFLSEITFFLLLPSQKYFLLAFYAEKQGFSDYINCLSQAAQMDIFLLNLYKI